jgi:hypothetical protein
MLMDKELSYSLGRDRYVYRKVAPILANSLTEQ